jgi:drug/metabolite transporter (DMT)-like permease
VALIAGTTAWVHAHRYLRGADGVDVASLRMFSACLAFVPVVLLTGGYGLSRIDWGGLLALAYGGLVGGFAAFMADFYTLKRFGATASSMTTYVIPVVSTALGVLFLDERVTPVTLLSTALILVGVWLLNRRAAM